MTEKNLENDGKNVEKSGKSWNSNETSSKIHENTPIKRLHLLCCGAFFETICGANAHQISSSCNLSEKKQCCVDTSSQRGVIQWSFMILLPIITHSSTILSQPRKKPWLTWLNFWRTWLNHRNVLTDSLSHHLLKKNHRRWTLRNPAMLVVSIPWRWNIRISGSSSHLIFMEDNPNISLTCSNHEPYQIRMKTTGYVTYVDLRWFDEDRDFMGF